MRFFKFLLICSFIAFSGSAQAGVDPTSASWTLYKVYLYESGGCTGTPQTVLDDSAGSTQDFVSNPTLATATVTDGTYNCVAVKMSDAVTFTASADEGTECTSGSSYTINVCPSSMSSTDADDSSTTACTDSAETVWVYISTWSTSTSGSETNNAFGPPTSSGDSVNGINLGSALTVSGTTTGTFVIDSSGKVATVGSGPGGTDECGFDQPAFSFE